MAQTKSLKDEYFPITLTPIALDMVKDAILSEEDEKQKGLRIAVCGGGCSGLGYVLDFEDVNTSRIGDRVKEIECVKVFIDMASEKYLKGTVIDYVEDLNGAGFRFHNPNMIRTCSCGNAPGGCQSES